MSFGMMTKKRRHVDMYAKNNLLLFFILVVAILVMPSDKGDPVIQSLANSFSSCCFFFLYSTFQRVVGLNDVVGGNVATSRRWCNLKGGPPPPPHHIIAI
jgi:hypothetical protein